MVGLGKVSMSQGAVHAACQCAPDRGGIHAEQKRELIYQLTGTMVEIEGENLRTACG